MADLSWEARLIEMDADAVRQRMAANAFRLGPPHIAALRRSVELALDEESRALEALEAESLRQQQQQQHAIKYGCATVQHTACCMCDRTVPNA